MKLKCLGSSSQGNGYILQSVTGEVLLIEAGIKLIEIKKALNFDISKITGCLVSHSHGDHSKYVKDYCNAGITCYSSFQTREILNIKNTNFIWLPEKAKIKIGTFEIMMFPVIHDVPCSGYLINHNESGMILFLTDTHYSHFTFPKIKHWLIEANFSDEIVEQNILKGYINPAMAKRVSCNHMSIDTCIKTLKANDLSETNQIVLLHLSSGNSDAEVFKKQVQSATGKPTFIADSNLELDFNKTSF